MTPCDAGDNALPLEYTLIDAVSRPGRPAASHADMPEQPFNQILTRPCLSDKKLKKGLIMHTVGKG